MNKQIDIIIEINLIKLCCFLYLFNKNEKYHIRVSIDLEAKKYSVFVSAPNQEEIQIANNFAFRSTAKAIDNIGKIYLFNTSYKNSSN